ncbi:hypothetical protein QBC35DRAFT_548613 [Podospora australis]|uniref:Uncharacterized protein n=1 Tax=Podospora australis TaxID=1536484 RepID=A0AAN6WZA6_9PEZI|nr:hypothetical protein QBC35DRAFT_548613 [Podospora australis]
MGFKFLPRPPQQDQRPWEERDVAFLKKKSTLPPTPRGQMTDIPEEATSHPVVILEISPDGNRALVTTVSAYGSAYGSTRMPWQNRRRDADYRAFLGSPLPPQPSGSSRAGSSKKREFLKLEAGCGSFAFPERSWVNAKSVWCVPIAALGDYHKAELGAGADCLRLTESSLRDLSSHVKQVAKVYQQQSGKLKDKEKASF